MRPAEKLARAFHEASEQIQHGLGHRPADQPATPWEQLPVRERVRLVVTIAYLLERDEIRGPEPRRRRDQSLADPRQVAEDLRAAGRILGDLEKHYEAAHEWLLSSGGGEPGGGRTSLHDVNPTRDLALDQARMVRRERVRQAAEKVYAARTELYNARAVLRKAMPEPAGKQQTKIAGDAFVSAGDFAASLARKDGPDA